MSTPDSVDLAILRYSDFEPHLDSTFVITTPEGESATLKLVSGSEYPQRQAAVEPGTRTPFSLVFLCETSVIPPNTYRVEHPELGSFDLFVSPFEAAGNGCRLEAIFN